MHPWHITTFYHFAPVADPAALKEHLRERGQALGMKALIILAAEGLNGTAGFTSEAERDQFESELNAFFRAALDFKRSLSVIPPFRKLSIKIRPEIVSLGRPDLVPARQANRLSAAQWDQAIAEGAVLLDTRNLDESRIGSFRGALLPDIGRFEQFPAAVEKMNLDPQQKILIFCTGGIRCEKAALALSEQGFRDVHQLDGGILRYLEETGGGSWEGECFVFDDRVAVDTRLQPSQRYRLCPHCGRPADQVLSCGQCGKEARLCPECATRSPVTCSKNCRHHAHRPSV
ncbi:MAG: hypothetical protein KF802_14500 [Bdellovibrionaceae bacterium]|nr:hypothetical protein [Pseudobdellovibrionaceae bacterium]